MEPAPGSFKTIPPAPLKLRARVIDVQRRPSASAVAFEQDLWSSIFSETIKDSDRLRIVAVSSPIESV
jgi:hypothetical protein